MYKVGTICIGQNFQVDTDRNGMECEITGPLGMRLALNKRTGAKYSAVRYTVRWSDGIEAIVAPHLLRPKLPPPGTGLESILNLFKETA